MESSWIEVTLTAPGERLEELAAILTGRGVTGMVIEDLGSLNGTWVDGAIVNAAPLRDGSSVQIGTFTLIYHETKPERIETGE